MARAPEFRIEVRIGRGHFAAILCCLLLGALSLTLDSETLTMSTTYPAPSGVYQTMVVTGQAALARDGGRVGVGTASPQAKLDVSATNDGFLPPRLTTVQRDAIAAPATGLMIYNTDTLSMEFYNGTTWEVVSDNTVKWVGMPAGTGYAGGGYWYWWPPDGLDHSATAICKAAGYTSAAGPCRTGYTPYSTLGPPWNSLLAYGSVTSVYWPLWGPPSWFLACNWYPWSYYIDTSGEILCRR